MLSTSCQLERRDSAAPGLDGAKLPFCCAAAATVAATAAPPMNIAAPIASCQELSTGEVRLLEGGPRLPARGAELTRCWELPSKRPALRAGLAGAGVTAAAVPPKTSRRKAWIRESIGDSFQCSVKPLGPPLCLSLCFARGNSGRRPPSTVPRPVGSSAPLLNGWAIVGAL